LHQETIKEIKDMITADQAKSYIGEFVPSETAQKEVLDVIERKIKSGDRHPTAYTTRFVRSYAEDLAKYCRSLGYTNARIVDIYNRRTGERGGNYLQIDL
jgi:hypothetical protein